MDDSAPTSMIAKAKITILPCSTVGEELIAAGARQAHWPSKLRRLLGDRLPGGN